MINEDMRKLEEQILNSSIPEDESDSRKSVVSDIGKKVKRQVQDEPKSFLLKGFIMIGCVIILLLFILIMNTLNTRNTRTISSNNQNNQNETTRQETLEGFEYLMETQSEGIEENNKEGDSGTEERITENNVYEEIDLTSDNELMETIPATNNYYVNPAITSAAPGDSLVQIGDKVYKLPVSMRELEEDGMVLITLGSQPPSEDVILSPQMRNGCMQYEGNRFTVTLKNGNDCTYHDLTVCEIGTTEEGSSIYLFEGITIGSEEASIPQGAERIEQDFAKINTFYYWGALNKELHNTTGKCTKIVVSNNTGKVVEVSVFDDATVTGTNN